MRADKPVADAAWASALAVHLCASAGKLQVGPFSGGSEAPSAVDDAGSAASEPEAVLEAWSTRGLSPSDEEPAEDGGGAPPAGTFPARAGDGLDSETEQGPAGCSWRSMRPAIVSRRVRQVAR